MNVEFTGFDWDEGNRGHCGKHGLTEEEIETFFRQDNLLISADSRYLGQEERYLAVGRARTGRPMLAVFTMRVVDESVLLRPISARYMHEREARRYEQESTKVQDR
ncbi:MAG: BrnT family toxin [Deltaproteobacteria bacterium]|nr:BrnT family toxin [Deltaproteobacteria bacterium]